MFDYMRAWETAFVHVVDSSDVSNLRVSVGFAHADQDSV